MEVNYFTIFYWFCHTLTWIRQGCTCVPHPEPPSHLPPHPSPEHPVSCIEPGRAVRFTYDNLHVSMLFSQTIPPSPSPPVSKRLLDSVGGGGGGMIWENSIEICILSYVKQITSPGLMHEIGCSGLVYWDDSAPREMGLGGRWEGCSGWGTDVHRWLIHVNV